MRGSRSWGDYLADIVAAMLKVEEFIAGMTFEEFEKDDKTAYAVIRGLEIVGEATKQIPADIRDQNPQVPWRSMAGMRDKLIHDYIGVNLEVVWRSASEELPKYRPALEKLLAELQ